jgi:AhpD family alkylhydroperoxidase
MPARMKNPAMLFPEAMQGIKAMQEAIDRGGVAPTTLGLVHLRASQINGCVVCVAGGEQHCRVVGDTDQRLGALESWRESSLFTDPERAALGLTEAVTRLADRADAVPDDLWNDAARHYDEPALAALVLHIALTNVYNRLNVTTGQVGGSWG